MAYGDGTITQIGRGKWRVFVTFGKDPVTGKVQRVTRTVSGSKADARRVRDQIKREREGGLTVDADRVTFAQHARQWRESYEVSSSVGESTLKANERVVRVLGAYIGDVKLKDVTPRLIESLYAKLKQDRGIGGTTLRSYHVKLKQIMQRAVDLDLIARNPCDRVKAPQKDTVRRRALNAGEVGLFVAVVDEEERKELAVLSDKEQRQVEWGKAEGRTAIRGVHHLSSIMAVRIGLFTGMRLGEVLGLTWQHVNLLAGKIDVCQTRTNYGELKQPKSDAGTRTISIDRDTAAHLANWKRVQAAQLAKIGVGQTCDTPVCCSDTGTFVNSANFEHWWSKWRAAHGFDGLKFHELRHTQATQLLANGVDVKTVQARLGHSNASLTLNTYAHAIPGNDEAAAQLVASIARPDGCRIYEVKTA